MFTQEQLGAIKGVMIEVIKPLEKKVDDGFKKMDEGFEMMNEKMDNMEKSLIARMDNGFDKMDQKIDFVDNKMDRIQKDVTVLKANKTLRDNGIVGDSGDPSYSPA